MRLIRRAAVAVSLLGACNSHTIPPDFFDPSELKKTYEDRVRVEVTAPIIVVGQVEDFGTTETRKAAQRDPNVKLELMSVSLRVEQTIKGPEPGPRLTFRYYAYSSANDRDLGTARYTTNVGQRRIYFLVSSPTGNRLLRDVGDYTVPIRSGYHPNHFCKESSVGCCIAEVLLTPGQGYDQKLFAKQLAGETSAATVFCSRARALELVKELLHHNDAHVVQAANEILKAGAPKSDP